MYLLHQSFRWAIIVATAAILFLPILLIGKMELFMESPFETKAGISIGIGVILRTTIRRLIRSTALGLTRTGIGVSTRMSSRVMARRFVRMAIRMFSRLIPLSSKFQKQIDSNELDPSDLPQNHALNTLVGCIALTASLYGVLHLLPEGTRSIILQNTPMWLFSMLGTIPMLTYLTLSPIWAKRCQVEVKSELSLSALLLQAYFTGAGSFLPLTNDLTYKGDSKSITNLATLNLFSLLCLHLILSLLEIIWPIPILSQLSALYLIYLFVFSFPLFPLEGFHIWKSSKIKWIVFWLFIIMMFNFNLSESMFTIL